MQTSRIALTAVAVLTIAVASTSAEAAKRRAPVRAAAPVLDVAAVPAYPTAEMPGRAGRRAAGLAVKASRTGDRSAREAGASPRPANSETAQDLGGRSGSCLNFPKTRRLWCGCFAADEVGLDNSSGYWNLAANFFSLPRAEPAHNRVAVRYGHVAVLKTHVSGSIWLAADGNSGGQRARLHEIDLRRFRAVVDPTGARAPQQHARRHAKRHRAANRSTNRL